MRIWLIPFGELDDQRVLGQHNEIHSLWTLIHKMNRPWERNWSVPSRRQTLWKVHENTVVEMKARGWNGHQTPIPFPDESPTYMGLPYPTTSELLLRDRWTLVLRWEGVYRGRIAAPAEYAPLFERYRAQGGCLHDGPTEDGEGPNRGWSLCLLCKRVKRQKGVVDAPWVARGWSRNG